jgi:hypothetical protein
MMVNQTKADEIKIDVDAISKILAAQFDAELNPVKQAPAQPAVSKNAAVASLQWAFNTATDVIPVVFILWAVSFFAYKDPSVICLGMAAFLYGCNLESLKRFNVHRFNASAWSSRLFTR